MYERDWKSKILPIFDVYIYMLRYEWTLKNSSIRIKKKTFNLTKSDNVSSKRNKT